MTPASASRVIVGAGPSLPGRNALREAAAEALRPPLNMVRVHRTFPGQPPRV
jgi:hypothetical protein